LLMRRTLALVLALPLCTATAAYAGDAALEAPIQKMEQGFNTGNLDLVRSVHVAAPTIIDEPPPFAWSGPGSLDRWLGDLAKEEATTGKTEGKVDLGTPIRETVNGDRAYVVTPSAYTFKQKGKTMRETGTITFVLVKAGAEWKIESWVWTSPEAAPVG